MTYNHNTDIIDFMMRIIGSTHFLILIIKYLNTGYNENSLLCHIAK